MRDDQSGEIRCSAVIHTGTTTPGSRGASGRGSLQHSPLMRLKNTDRCQSHRKTDFQVHSHVTLQLLLLAVISCWACGDGPRVSSSPNLRCGPKTTPAPPVWMVMFGVVEQPCLRRWSR
jgi:hypothetical protein